MLKILFRWNRHETIYTYLMKGLIKSRYIFALNYLCRNNLKIIILPRTLPLVVKRIFKCS